MSDKTSLIKTKVGKYKIPVIKSQKYSVLTFKGGEHGKKEHGDYAFWTAVLKKKKKGKLADGKLIGVVIARARIANPPGERFDRMRKEMRSSKKRGDRAVYRDIWENNFCGGKNIKHIRPSSADEIVRWLSCHKKDSKYLISMSIGQ